MNTGRQNLTKPGNMVSLGVKNPGQQQRIEMGHSLYLNKSTV
jgi:hypothetical protein